MCDLETSRIGAPYIYDISNLRVNTAQGKSVTSVSGTVRTVQDFVKLGCPGL